MSHNNGGFFSLNRLFGKKIKHEKICNYSFVHKIEKSWNQRIWLNVVLFPIDIPASIGVSKSTIQTLTRSTTDPEGILPQNKIVPLATVPNAPFEQTFRITILLPLGQLYVARIGAKTKLSELLRTICTNKSLDSNKFEFKHPSEFTNCQNFAFILKLIGWNLFDNLVTFFQRMIAKFSI